MSGSEEDVIWNSSRTAQQIHDLGRVENVPTHPVHLRSFTSNASSRTLAASSPSLAPLSLSSPSPRPTRQMPVSRRATSAASNSLPRSANTLRLSTCVPPPPFSFLLTQQIGTLQIIQMALRSSLAHIRAARISPPPAGFVPPPQGIGLPTPPAPGGQLLSSDAGGGGGGGGVKEQTRGLLKERVERDAWGGVLDALTRLRES